LQEQGRLDEAITSYQKAISIKPDIAEAYYNLGTVLKGRGKLNEAVTSFQKAISIKPDFAEAYRSLSTSRKFTDISETLGIKVTLSNAKTDNDKMHLNFALGKAMLDIKHDSDAFQYFLEGNKIERETLQFDIADTEQMFKKFQTKFDKSFFRSRKGFGCKDNTPIFILGMPRSGSTIIEQILSSHPNVYGAGELPHIRQSLMQNLPSDKISMIPHKVAQLMLDDINKIGESYIERVRDIEPNVKFITDKMPENFLYIGIIKLILPNAKIIHSVRSPEDTCFSIFREKFMGVNNYAYDLAEIGQYYRLYTEMMRHWHLVLPGEIYDCNYEKLIANQEEETRKLLDFCGLEWNIKCLNFHKTVRNIKTASNYQARQPMYTSSINGWKRFEKQLQPLIEALGDLASEPIMSPR
jgi:tetratricopeptide (TPR) repeat protein